MTEMQAEVYDRKSHNSIFFGSVEEAIDLCENRLRNPTGLVIWKVDPEGNLGDMVREYNGPLVTP